MSKWIIAGTMNSPQLFDCRKIVGVYTSNSQEWGDVEVINVVCRVDDGTDLLMFSCTFEHHAEWILNDIGRFLATSESKDSRFLDLCLNAQGDNGVYARWSHGRSA